MTGAQEIVEALDQIFKSNIINLILFAITSTTLFMLLRLVAESLTGYIQFRLDKYISIGSPVEVYGKKGRVQKVTIFTIFIQTECGYIRIPIKNWRTSKFVALNDNTVLRNRRKDDK